MVVDGFLLVICFTLFLKQPLAFFYANGCITHMFLLKIPNSTRAEPIVILIVVVLIPIIEVLVPRVVIVAGVLGRALANKRKGVFMCARHLAACQSLRA